MFGPFISAGGQMGQEAAIRSMVDPFLGPIGLITGPIYTKMATQQQIFLLRHQINQIISTHKFEVDKTKELQKKMIESYHNESLYQGVINLGGAIKDNLKMVMQSHKQKIEALKSINLMNGENISDYDMAGKGAQAMTEILVGVGRVAVDVLMIAAGIGTGNIVQAGIGIFDLLFTTILNYKGLFEDLQQISRLQSKCIEFEQYFKKGGEFDRHMELVLNYTIDGVHNLSIVFYFWNSLVNELHAWLQILKIIIPNIETGALSQLQKKLSQNPVKESFLHDITELESQVSKTVKRQTNRRQGSVEFIVNILNKFDQDHNLKTIFQSMALMANLFSQQSIGYITIKKYLDGFKDLSFLIKQNAHLFNKNKKIISQWYSQEDIDKQILKKLQKRVSVSDSVPENYQQKIKEDKIALIIVSFTDKFYADDKTGNSIFKINLSEIRERYNYIRFLNSETGVFQKNIILIPKPLNEDKEGLKSYNQTKKILYDQYSSASKKPADSIEKFEVYLCMKTQVYRVRQQSSNRLVLYKRIQHQNHSDQYYQISNEDFLKKLHKL